MLRLKIHNDLAFISRSDFFQTEPSACRLSPSDCLNHPSATGGRQRREDYKVEKWLMTIFSFQMNNISGGGTVRKWSAGSVLKRGNEENILSPGTLQSQGYYFGGTDYAFKTPVFY